MPNLVLNRVFVPTPRISLRLSVIEAFGAWSTANRVREAIAVGSLPRAEADHAARRGRVWVPTIPSMSRDQAIFVDHAADASLPSDVVLLKIDWFG